MAKGKILEDTFEQLVELGQSTAKKTVKSVAQTFNPFDKANNASKDESKEQYKKEVEKLKRKKDNHTPLDFDKLKDKFQDKEKAQADALRNRLFQMVRQGDERVLMEKKQKDLEKKRHEEYEKQKKEQDLKRKKQQQANDAPQGKVRKNIFSHKKVAERQQAEVKPATGKQ